MVIENWILIIFLSLLNITWFYNKIFGILHERSKVVYTFLEKHSALLLWESHLTPT